MTSRHRKYLFLITVILAAVSLASAWTTSWKGDRRNDPAQSARLLQRKSSEYILGFSISPDGSLLAVRRQLKTEAGGDRVELWVLPIGSSDRLALLDARMVRAANTKDELIGSVLSWHPTSKSLLYYDWNRKTQEKKLWELSVADFENRALVALSRGNLLSAFWTTDTQVCAQISDEMWLINTKQVRKVTLPKGQGDICSLFSLKGGLAICAVTSIDEANPHRNLIAFDLLKQKTVLLSKNVLGEPVYRSQSQSVQFIRIGNRGVLEVVTVTLEHKAIESKVSVHSEILWVSPSVPVTSTPVVSPDGKMFAGTHTIGDSQAKHNALYLQTPERQGRLTDVSTGEPLIGRDLQWLSNRVILFVSPGFIGKPGESHVDQEVLRTYNIHTKAVQSIVIP